MNRSIDLEGVHGTGHKCVGFGVSRAARSPRFQPNNWVLRQKMKRTFVLMVFFHYLSIGMEMERDDRCE